MKFFIEQTRIIFIEQKIRPLGIFLSWVIGSSLNCNYTYLARFRKLNNTINLHLKRRSKKNLCFIRCELLQGKGRYFITQEESLFKHNCYWKTRYDTLDQKLFATVNNIRCITLEFQLHMCD